MPVAPKVRFLVEQLGSQVRLRSDETQVRMINFVDGSTTIVTRSHARGSCY
jgi:hypothetical protein